GAASSRNQGATISRNWGARSFRNQGADCLGICIPEDISRPIDNGRNPNHGKREDERVELRKENPRLFGVPEPAKVSAPATDFVRVKRVGDPVRGAECGVSRFQLVDIFLPDEKPAQAEAVHSVLAFLRELMIGIPAAGIVNEKVIFRECGHL
ncbi:hypothetical protein, partial [Sinorhizobium meliloti]|uniref:hypothetical protein n=1 Tax=Rhizobium meliloti TaxID=382 RepID=UPI001AECEC4B